MTLEEAVEIYQLCSLGTDIVCSECPLDESIEFEELGIIERPCLVIRCLSDGLKDKGT